ncbi:hypothetical protein [Streptomyces goshikiensis]|uniref:hypothetical protein n=1 Tax=Streptomyces goshikiensis TaxID=1942 RepID=UPI003666ADEB
MHSSKHWAYGHEERARDRLKELTEQHPPTVTVEEAANPLETTGEAVAQAIARAKRDRTARTGRPPLPLAVRLDRTDWYNLRD